MGNVHRIQWFDLQIREGKYPNSRLLSEKFEISTRQAQRDIEYMEISLGAPLMYIAQKRGYCYEDKTYLLPLLYMTEEEKSILNYLIHRYRNYDYENTASVQRVAHLLGRFTQEQAIERPFPVFYVSPKEVQNYELLAHAIKESLIARITYKEEHSEKAIEALPLAFLSKYSADYVRVYDFERSEEVEFRLDRILSLTITAEKVEDDRLRDAASEDTQLRIKPFTAKIRLIGGLSIESWHGYAVKEIEAGLYGIDFYEEEIFMKDLIFYMNEWNELVSPKWLKSKLQNRCEILIEQLKSSWGIENERGKE